MDKRRKDVVEGKERLVELRNSFREIDEKRAAAQGLSTRILETLAQIQAELATYEAQTIAKRESVNKLKADVRSAEEGAKRLSGGTPSQEVPGRNVRSFVGDGDRQYLSGLKVGGKRIFILADGSASMLAEDIVNAVRRHLFPPATRLRARKWRQCVKAVDWLTAQMPRGSQYQLYVFNTTARPVLAGTDGVWLDAKDGKTVDKAVGGPGPDGARRGDQPLPGLRGGEGHEPPAGQHHPAHRRPAHPGRHGSRPQDRLREGAPAPLRPGARRAAARRARQRHPVPHGGGPHGLDRFLEAGHGEPGVLHDPLERLAVKRRERRPFEVFSLSFLDVVCCGFGAIILLFVLNKMGEPAALERAKEDLSGLLARLEEELAVVRGETTVLNRDLRGREEQVSEERLKVARLQGDLSRVQGQFAATKELSEVQDIIAGRLRAAQQELSEEMKRLQKQQEEAYRRPPDAPVGGIPVDSEYVVFIIDTSGSMQRFAWPAVRKKMDEVLNAYPKVRGLQIMNDEGVYMFPHYAGKWIPDTPARRQAIRERLSSWNAFSNSSPVEGIEAAIKTFWSADKKISLYVLGDEFTGDSIDEVLDGGGPAEPPRRAGPAEGPHPRHRLPDPLLAVPVPRGHRHPLRHAHAGPLREKRRRLRRPQLHGSLVGVGSRSASWAGEIRPHLPLCPFSLLSVVPFWNAPSKARGAVLLRKRLDGAG